MIRVAICDNDSAGRTRLRNAIERYVAGLGIDNVETALLGNVADLSIVMERLRENYFDLVLCSLDTEAPDVGAAAGNAGGEHRPGEAPSCDAHVAVLRRLRETSPLTEFTLYSASADKAICAYDVVAGFFKSPCDKESFARTIACHLRNAGERKKSLFAVKTSRGLQNVDLRGVTFVESSKKGPIIHASGGRTVPARGTLQALFERLSAVNPDFVKAGGSFIVNLDNIRTTGESSVIFGDGEAIIVPIRARKPLKETFTAYRLRPEFAQGR